jgi:hypothetical protein
MTMMLSPRNPFRSRPWLLAWVSALAIGGPRPLFAQDVLTWRNDNQRTGQNLQETTLTPASVASPAFGLLFSRGVDGYVYAQPLYKSNVAISGMGTHNVVFVATEHNSVYAFDADSNSGSNANPLWHVTLGPSANIDGNIGPEVGITGTPVIDPGTGTLYVVPVTLEGGTCYQRLHALDIGSGAEKFGGPVVISPSVPGSGDSSSGGTVLFNPLTQHQRPALLLSGGVVYVAWGSHGDNRPYHGWVVGFNASNLAQVSVFNNTPNDAEGGIWMAGAIAADAGGNVFATSGNGTVNPTPGGASYGNCVIKLTSGLSVADYFAPYNTASANSMDLDLGAGGCLVLPDQGGSFPHLLIQGGKDGVLRVLNRDNLGQFNPGGDHVVQAVNLPSQGMLFGTCAYFFDGANHWVLEKDIGPGYGSSPTPLNQYRLTNGLLSTSPVTQSSVSWSSRCGSPVVSANGTSAGIVWAIESANPGVLRAWDATNLNNYLYSSSTKSSDTLGPGIKFSVPCVGGGHVYVGTATGLYYYGLPPTNPTPPSITMQPANQTVTAGLTATFAVAASGTAPLSFQWQKNGGNLPGATGASYTTPPTSAADSGSTFRCVVTNSAGSATSTSATLTVTSVAVPPAITTQPSSQGVLVGQTATFTVAATGTGPLSYQWQKNGSNISGATGVSYTTPATTTADSGSTFRCVVTNSAGTATSSSATLTVTVAAPAIVTPPASQAVTLGQTATFSVVASGTAPLSYQWQKNGTAIAGATGASYTTPATTAADSGAAYRVVVSNSAGTATSAAASLTVDVPPTILTQPANETVYTGQSATFTVVASGSGPLYYQWMRNGSNIAGATGASYTTPAVTPSDNGATYEVVVTNMAGTVTSENATLFFGTGLAAKGACGLLGLEGLALGLVARASRRRRRR